MARTRTLAELRTDVCDRADIVDGGTTGRHTSARLNRYINQSIQRYRSFVIEAGGTDYFMKRTGLLTLSTSQTRDAAGWAPYMYAPLPADFLDLIGVDIIINGQVTTLQQFERAERNMFRASPNWAVGVGTGQPVFFRVGGLNAAGLQVLQLIPFTDSAYQYEILYVPVLADLAQDADTFDGIAGWEEFVTNDAALAALINDGGTNVALQGAIMQDRDDTQKKMTFRIATMGGPARRVNTEDARRLSWAIARGEWWGR